MRPLCIVASLCFACADSSDIKLGVIQFYGDAPVIDVPMEAMAGVPFLVRVRTYGNGCSMAAHTEVDATDAHADIAPYDHERACKVLFLSHFGHEATLQFDTAGTKTVRVRGRRIPPTDEDLVIEVWRQIVIE